jgi:endo-1,4-beta-D-glucanase Y
VYKRQASKVSSEFARWKKNNLQACNGGHLVLCQDGNTRVEGIGFGALLTVYMANKIEFDGIIKFYESKCNSQSGGMMSWEVNCQSIVKDGSATDGDIDVAFALVIASWQWPDGGYADKAKKVIANLRQKVVKSCTGDVMALATGYSGSSWGGCDYTDISYYNPAAFREFAKISGDNSWNKLADDTYVLLKRAANTSTGLVPDWQTLSGQAGGGGREGTYKYDACRTPWRIALDYLWNGNKEAQAWCKKVSDWAYTIGPKNIKDGYSLSGTASGTTHNMCFTGGFACAAMCNSQEIANAFAAEMSVIASNDKEWFTFCVGLCNMITLTGNQWRPEMVKIESAERTPMNSTEANLQWHYDNRENILVSARGGTASLISLSGQCAAKSRFTEGTALIDVSSLNSGCYILQVDGRVAAGSKSAMVMVH